MTSLLSDYIQELGVQQGRRQGKVQGGVDKKMPTRKQLIVCNTKLLVPNSSCALKFLGKKY